jgi:murein L,D-transpeptidase YafK
VKTRRPLPCCSALAPIALLALCGIPATAGAASELVLPEGQIFPGGDGAAPDTLDRPLTELLDAWKKRTGKRKFRKRIVVHKARRRMDVFADDDIVKSYVVSLGLSPTGAKRVQGDMRTPEGDFFVCTVNRVSQFTRFLGLSYPSPVEAAEGVAAGRVGAEVERAAREAYRARDRCPPQLTRLGGAVGIHGKSEWERRPEGYALVDWTWGCVAVRDPDILELFEHYAEVGIPVRIEKE